MDTQHADILILGGGAGGGELSRFLAKKLKRIKSGKKITLIDNKDHFVFVPLLHEVGAGTISGDQASVDFKKFLPSGHTFVQATVKSIDTREKKVLTSAGKFTYEYCVIGLGSQTNYFNTPGAEEFTYNIRTRESTEELNKAFKKLETKGTPFTINVIGGGFTGTEVAAELAYHLRKKRGITINLVHSKDELVQTMPSSLRKKVVKRLKKLGVNILFNERAVEVTKQKVILKDGTELPNDITIWATGFLSTADSYLPEGSNINCGRIPINEFLLTEFDKTYSIGDISLFINKNEEKPVPQLAETAWHQGLYIARHIANDLKGKQTKPFKFHQIGSLLPLGNWYGVGTVGPLKFSGLIAWIMRQTAYVIFFPTLKGKIRLIWAWIRP